MLGHATLHISLAVYEYLCTVRQENFATGKNANLADSGNIRVQEIFVKFTENSCARKFPVLRYTERRFCSNVFCLLHSLLFFFNFFCLQNIYS